MNSNDILPKTRTSQIAYNIPTTHGLSYASAAAQAAIED